MTLTDKQAAFIEHYLVDFNATKAALSAGYSEKTAHSIGHENLRKPEIVEHIQKRLNDLKMTADEALSLLANQARSSIADYIEIDEKDGTFNINFKELKPEQLRAIKSVGIKKTKDGTSYQFELYDAQSAIKEIIRLHRLDNGQATETMEIKHKIDYSALSDEELRAIASRATK